MGIYLLPLGGKIIGLEILYLLMGGIASPSLKDLDLNSATVLCVGFSSDIVYSAERYSLSYRASPPTRS